MDHQKVRHHLKLRQELLEEWISLGIERVWGLICARTPALVLPGEIWVEGVHVTPARRMVPVTVHIQLGNGDQHDLVISTAPAPRRARPPAILPPSDRDTARILTVDMSFGTEPAEEDPQYVRSILDQAADRLLSAAADVVNDRRVSYVVGIVVRAGDMNWPHGVVSVGPYLLAQIPGGKDFEFPALVLTRTVSEFSRGTCEVRWSERLNRAATLIGILVGVNVRLTDEVPAELRGRFGIAFHPFVEKPTTPLASFLAGLSPVPTYDPYDKNVPGIDRLSAVPQDLGILFNAYDSLTKQSREVLDDALTALQVSIELRLKLPSSYLTAVWTALECLCKVDPSFFAEGKKRAKVARKARRKVSDAQEAILAMAETLLGVRTSLGDLATALEWVRGIRNDWAHEGRLGGMDLSTQPETWVAHTLGTIPRWAQIDGLSRTMDELARRLVIALLMRFSTTGTSRSS